jgi:hypothetical protein
MIRIAITQAAFEAIGLGHGHGFGKASTLVDRLES